MHDVFDLNFRPYSHSELASTGSTIAELISVHPGYQIEWPNHVPNPTEINEQSLNFKESILAASKGDRDRIAERNQKRRELVRSLTFVAQFCIMRSVRENNPDLLHNTGYVMKNRSTVKRSGSTRVTRVETPNPVVKHGAVSGTVKVSTKRVAVGGTYQLQICLGEPVSEDSWKDGGTSTHSRSREVKDLEVGNRYFFRMRYHGANGPGPWSEAVSIIVI